MNSDVRRYSSNAMKKSGEQRNPIGDASANGFYSPSSILSPPRTILGKYNFERITTRKHNHKWAGRAVLEGELGSFWELKGFWGWREHVRILARTRMQHRKWSVRAALGHRPSILAIDMRRGFFFRSRGMRGVCWIGRFWGSRGTFQGSYTLNKQIFIFKETAACEDAISTQDMEILLVLDRKSGDN